MRNEGHKKRELSFIFISTKFVALGWYGFCFRFIEFYLRLIFLLIIINLRKNTLWLFYMQCKLVYRIYRFIWVLSEIDFSTDNTKFTENTLQIYIQSNLVYKIYTQSDSFIPFLSLLSELKWKKMSEKKMYTYL